MFKYKDIKITWYGHDSFLIQSGKTNIFIDPYLITSRHQNIPRNISLILISHEHPDHFTPEDLMEISSNDTNILTTTEVRNQIVQLPPFRVAHIVPLKPYEAHKFKEGTIQALPAYNTNKFREPKHVFHPKEANHIGFMITLGKVKFYFAGDTDIIPEMKDLKPDIAFLPVSGTYVMTSTEAIEAMKLIKPIHVIPMHYGSIIGSEQDALKLKNAFPKETVILLPER